MANITPNTDVYLLKGVPLDDTYEHTVFFTNRTEQHDWFIKYASTSYTERNYTYQRVNKNTVRVGASYDDIYNRNYMMFKNTNYENRWFYAFIKEINYINNGCCEIVYEMDVLQTWHFDYTLDSCFVARMHQPLDTFGSNLQPEPVKAGEMQTYGYDKLGLKTDTQPSQLSTDSLADLAIAVNIASPIGDSGDGGDVPTDKIINVPEGGHIYQNVFCGSSILAFDDENEEGIKQIVEQFIQAPDNILAMYMFPKYMIDEEPAIYGTHILDHIQTRTVKLKTPERTLVEMSEDDYRIKVRNKKCLTYPYCYYGVDNASGNTAIFRSEFFDDNKPEFEIKGTITQPVSVAMYPVGYKNTGYHVNDPIPLKTESLKLEGYPSCSWSVDYYTMWLAQNSVGMGIKAASIGTGALIAAATMPVVGLPLVATGGFVGASSKVFDMISQTYTASIQADISKGSYDNGGVNCANTEQAFYGAYYVPTREQLNVIDDYFDRFGYAINRVIQPRRHARKVWTYLQTVGCSITGSVPSDAMKVICEIYDKGITWWDKEAKVCEYNAQKDENVAGRIPVEEGM